MAALQAAGGESSGRAKKKAAKRAAAALAAVEEAQKNKGLKGGFRLPDGQRCSKGSCGFALMGVTNCTRTATEW